MTRIPRRMRAGLTKQQHGGPVAIFFESLVRVIRGARSHLSTNQVDSRILISSTRQIRTDIKGFTGQSRGINDPATVLCRRNKTTVICRRGETRSNLSRSMTVGGESCRSWEVESWGQPFVYVLEGTYKIEHCCCWNPVELRNLAPFPLSLNSQFLPRCAEFCLLPLPPCCCLVQPRFNPSRDTGQLICISFQSKLHPQYIWIWIYENHICELRMKHEWNLILAVCF